MSHVRVAHLYHLSLGSLHLELEKVVGLLHSTRHITSPRAILDQHSHCKTCTRLLINSVV